MRGAKKVSKLINHPVVCLDIGEQKKKLEKLKNNFSKLRQQSEICPNIVARVALRPASEDFGGRVTVPGGNLRLGPIPITYRSLYHSCPQCDQSVHTTHTRTGQPELRSRLQRAWKPAVPPTVRGAFRLRSFRNMYCCARVFFQQGG
jgi:hypothetical protein